MYLYFERDQHTKHNINHHEICLNRINKQYQRITKKLSGSEYSAKIEVT